MSKIYTSKSDNSIATPVASTMSNDVLFFHGAIKAAQNSSPKVRDKILTDLGVMMNCDPAQFQYLFDAQNDHHNHSFYDFPDSERRRLIIRNNRLDAAE